MSYLSTYTLAGTNIGVDRAKISESDLLELDQLAASGTKADLQIFVTILSRYPTAAYRFLPPAPLLPQGPLGPLDDDLLDKLDIDIGGIIAMAMLLCMQVEREMRQMGLQMSKHELDQMVAMATQIRTEDKKANEARLYADRAGAAAGIVSGGLGGIGGAASFGKMGHGETLAASAKRRQEQLTGEQKTLTQIREQSNTIFSTSMEKIRTRKTNLEALRDDAKQTKDQITELRNKVLSDRNNRRQCDADDAAKVQLERKEAELDAAKIEEQESAKELKALDASGGATTPPNVDPVQYRTDLQARHSREKAEVDRLQGERDTLLDTAMTDTPAAAAPFLQRDRDAVRTEIASKQREKLELKQTLVEIDAKKKRLVWEGDDLATRKTNGEKVEEGESDRLDAEIQTVADREARATQALTTKDTEIASLKAKEAALDAKLDGLIPAAAKAERTALIDRVRRQEAKVQRLQDEKADLESQIESKDLEISTLRESGGPAPQTAAETARLKAEKKALEADRDAKSEEITAEINVLRTKRDELEANDLQKLDTAEARLKEQESEINTTSNLVDKEEADLLGAEQRNKAVFEAEAKRIDDGLQAVEDKLTRAKSATEAAAAWRVGLDAIGKVVAGFVNLWEAELKRTASDLEADARYTGKRFDILQIGQGLYSTFADNIKAGSDGARECFDGILQRTADTYQSVAQKM